VARTTCCAEKKPQRLIDPGGIPGLANSDCGAPQLAELVASSRSVRSAQQDRRHLAKTSRQNAGILVFSGANALQASGALTDASPRGG
jgi:hypothetical protein